MRGLILAIVLCASASPAVAQPSISTHENDRSAGEFQNGKLALRLFVGLGKWRPESDSGPDVTVQAFGVEGQGLTVPGPLVRVPAGSTIDVSIHNTLSMLVEVHGFETRPMASDRAIEIAAGETKHVSFAAGEIGTYHYWATTTHGSIANRYGIDSQLGGALIVDAAAEGNDRVFLMTNWFALRPSATTGVPDPADPRELYVINGRSWPHTPRLRYHTGDTVRWRLINLSGIDHPMHLHGFYFGVDAVGDGRRSTRFEGRDVRRAVTESIQIGGTLQLSWRPEREGNWLFHCHIVSHVSTSLGLSPTASVEDHAHDSGVGMRGLVLGITVVSPVASAPSTPGPARRITMTLGEVAGRFGQETGYGFSADGAKTVTPGPLLVLKRDEPVEITLKNTLNEPTAIHWHGMELESYFDGVPGFSGTTAGITPSIPPGGEFVAKFTPPRAGTFMYHTHSHDERLLGKGLFGPMIVVEPGERFDQSVDHVLILGWNGSERGGANADDQVLLNGEPEPIIPMKPGVSNRLRLINITPGQNGLNVFVMRGLAGARWTLVAKDGAATPEAQRTTGVARQNVGVGEIYDFEYVPTEGPQWIEVRRGNGRFLIQAPIVTR